MSKLVLKVIHVSKEATVYKTWENISQPHTSPNKNNKQNKTMDEPHYTCIPQKFNPAFTFEKSVKVAIACRLRERYEYGALHVRNIAVGINSLRTLHKRATINIEQHRQLFGVFDICDSKYGWSTGDLHRTLTLIRSTTQYQHAFRITNHFWRETADDWWMKKRKNDIHVW